MDHLREFSINADLTKEIALLFLFFRASLAKEGNLLPKLLEQLSDDIPELNGSEGGKYLVVREGHLEIWQMRCYQLVEIAKLFFQITVSGNLSQDCS